MGIIKDINMFLYRSLNPTFKKIPFFTSFIKFNKVQSKNLLEEY